MKSKDNLPAMLLHGPNISPIIEAYFEFNHLKQLYRQGWLRRGISPERCESVAEHSWGVALLALFLADACFPTLDRDKTVRMALLHDFGEIYAGDFTPADDIGQEEKHQLEAQSIRQVLAQLPGGETYVALWEEFEQGESAEARLVRQLDRLEMALQASVYEHQGLANLSEFFASAREALAEPQLQYILDELQALRPRIVQ